jgi:hypothetical protein
MSRLGVAMTSGHISENKRLTARERWLREHRELRLYLKHNEYELLESLASEEHLTVKDFILTLTGQLMQLKKQAPVLEKLGVNCRPANVFECIEQFWVKLVLEQLEHAICMNQLERLKRSPY